LLRCIFAVSDLMQFISGFQIEMSMVHTAVRPLLLLLGDFQNLTLNRIQVLSSLTDLFPNTFNEKLCEQLLVCYLSSYSLYYVWLCSLTVACRTSDREVAGSIPAVPLPGNNPGQVVHTRVPLSPSSIIWYQLNRREGNGSIWERCGLPPI